MANVKVALAIGARMDIIMNEGVAPGRLQTPEKVSDFASGSAGCISGQTMLTDGGMVMTQKKRSNESCDR